MMNVKLSIVKIMKNEATYTHICDEVELLAKNFLIRSFISFPVIVSYSINAFAKICVSFFGVESVALFCVTYITKNKKFDLKNYYQKD